MMPSGFYRRLLQDRCLRWRYRFADRRTGRTAANGSAILMFHHVAEVCPAGVSLSCYSSIADFKMLLTNLSRNKVFVSIDSLVNQLSYNNVPENQIVLTFDDVPSDFRRNAAPFLYEREYPFTLYIATSLLDTEGYLSTSDVKELASNPLCTIGSHTVGHVKVRDNGVDFLGEITLSKYKLEQITGKPVCHFAFPYGTPFAVSSRQVKILKESDLYRSAVSTIPGYINDYSASHLFFLPRIHSGLFIQEYLK